MFGNQTLLCQVVLPVRSCAAAIRPDRERAWRAPWRVGWALRVDSPAWPPYFTGHVGACCPTLRLH